MSTYLEKLDYLEETKDLIKNAIESKGVSVSDTDTFRDYADKIGEISGGGTGEIPRGTQLTLDDFPLCKALKEERYKQPFTFYDFDGTVLGTYTREQIQAMTSEEEFPAPIGNTEYPIHFDRWNWTLEELKEQPYGVDIGALYDHDTVDFAIYIKPEEEVSFKFGMSSNSTICKFFIQNVDTEEYLYQDLNIGPTQSFTVPAGHYLIGVVNYSNGNFDSLLASNDKDILNKLNIQMVCMNKSMSQHHMYEPLFYKSVSYAKDVRVKQYVCNLENKTGQNSVIDLVGYTDFIAEPRRLTRWSCSTKSAISPIKANSLDSIYYYNAKEAIIPREKYIANSVYFDTYQGKTFFSEANINFPQGQYLEAVYLETTKTSLSDATVGTNKIPNLKEVYVQGANLQELSLYTLKDCREIKKFIVPDGVRSLAGVPQNVESIYLPDTLEKIKDDTFKNCKRLKTLYIPDSVQTIGKEAFAGTMLTQDNLRLPENVKISPEGVFASTPIRKPWKDFELTSTTNYGLCPGCYFLEGELVVPEIITSLKVGSDGAGSNYFIPQGLAAQCYSITKVVLPNSITEIADYSFSECISLEEVNIPINTTKINQYAFSYCKSLKEITLPETLTTLGAYCFSNCSSLKKVILPNSLTSLGSGYTNGNVFNYCRGLEEITLGNNLKSIGSSTFNECSSLKSITIPASVSDMNAGSIFSGCNSLVEYHMKPTTPPTLNSSAFGYSATLPAGADARIYVPYSEDHSILAAYKAATNWSKYATYIVEEPSSSEEEND